MSSEYLKLIVRDHESVSLYLSAWWLVLRQRWWEKMVIYITSWSVWVLDLGGSMCSGVCVGMLDGSSSKLGDAADDDSSKLGGVADDSLMELGDTTDDCPGKLGDEVDGSLAHLLDLIASICAFRAHFLCQLLLSEAIGVASEDSIVCVSIDWTGHCCSSIVFFERQASSQVTFKSVIVSSGEIIAEIGQAIFRIYKRRPYCQWQHAITNARKRVTGLTRIARDLNELISLTEIAIVGSNTLILWTVCHTWNLEADLDSTGNSPQNGVQ